MKNFYIGAKVIAIKDHSQGAFQKGDKFVIKDLKKGCCGYNNMIVDIGMASTRGVLSCNKCNYLEISEIWWFGAICFRIIEDAPELSNSTVEELLEELETIPIVKIDPVFNILEKFIKEHSKST